VKKTVFVIPILLVASTAWGALLLEENFDYTAGVDIVGGGRPWTYHSGTTGIIFVRSPGLSYSGYISSNIGNAAEADTTGYDANAVFDSVMSGPVYSSFMLRVGSNGAPTGYFYHFAPPTTGTSFWARVYGQNVTGEDSFRLGLAKYTETATYSTVKYSYNQTYLVVVKHNILSGTLNDSVSLYVFETGVPGIEPATPTVGPLAPAVTDPTRLGSVCLRQYAANQNYMVDGIRIGTTWADVCPSTSTPFISATPGSLGFDTLLLNDTSAVQSYTVSGSNLTAGITVTAPSTDFRVSLTSGSGYTNTLTIPQSGGSVPATPVYVIFKPTSTEGARSGNITNTSTGADAQNVAVSGYGIKIKLLSSLASFGGVEVGQTSAEQFYTYQASELSVGEDLTISAPSHYQISWTSGSGFTTSLIKPIPSGGRLPLDTVFVRFVPSTTGTKSDSISHTSMGAVARYRRVYGRGVAAEPTLQASNIQFSGVDSLKMTVSWTRPGGNTGCIVVARCEGPVTNVPWDGSYYPYTAGVTDSFGKGYSLGAGHYVVYKGTGSSVTVRKLYGITTYHFAVFEYNGPDSCENYLTSTYPTGYQITNSMSGKISLTILGSAYNQDFNTLDTISQSLPQGWNYREEGSAANYLYAANNGNLNTGNLYGYGMTDSSDRAFGGLQTSSLIPTISAVFTNNTGGTLSSIDIAYWGELWRLGLQRYDSLKLELSTVPGTWVAYPQLNFVTPDTTGAYGARDGNHWLYRSYPCASIPGLNIANGADFRVRWLDANATSYDDGMAVDDFRLIPFNGNSIPRIAGTLPADSAKNVAVNAPVKIGFSEPMNTSSLAYTCTPDPGGWSASWNAAGDTVTLSHNNFQYHQVGQGYTFTVTQARDTEGLDLAAGNAPNPFSFTTVYNPNAPPMYITMINVGQGDCMVIRSPTGKRILVDAGDGGDDLMITNFIKDSIDIGTNTKFLDYTFLSHYHDDHGGGLDEVISRMDSLRVGAYDRGDWHAAGNSTYENYIDSLASKGWSAKRHPVTMGQTFDIGGGASIQVITYNGKTLSGDSIVPGSTDENNHSMGLLLNYADKFKMVMCGDIGKNIERILSPDLGGRVSVLKANHHGSDDASSLKWVTDLNPMVTLIPVGDGNSYGHVHIGARDSLLADPKTSKAAGDSNRLYRTELGSGAPCVAGRDFAMNQNIHIEVVPANTSYCFKVLNDGSTYPWLGGTPLAVHLSAFTASVAEDNAIRLRWRTESEEDTYLWEIERSVNADENYAQIGTLPGQGTTSQPHDYEYADREELEAGTYWYRLCEVELSGKRSYYGPVSLEYYPGGRSEFALWAARPNPFSQITTISYQIAKGGPASLKIYNVLGQEVRTLAEGEHKAGRHQAVWDGRDGRGRKVSSGVYFYRLTAAVGEAGENRASGKLLRLR